MRLKHFNLTVGEQFLKAIADVSRLRILNLILHNQEMCISDLEQVLDFTQTKTSRHLTYLRNAGLVSNKKIDQWVYYSLKEETHDLVQQMLSYLEKDTTLLKDQETYQILFSNRELAKNKLQSRRWMPAD